MGLYKGSPKTLKPFTSHTFKSIYLLRLLGVTNPSCYDNILLTVRQRNKQKTDKQG